MVGDGSGGAGSVAAAALVANHRRFLAFLERRVESREAAEEILQAAFVRGLEHAGEIRDEERAVPWFFRLLRNAVVDHWRSRAVETRAREAVERELGRAGEPSAGPEVEAELEAEICRCFEALLPALRPEYAQILRRVDLEGARPVDFAAEAGLTANNTMVRLHRARQALRERLTASCRTCAEHGCLDCDCRRPPPAALGRPAAGEL